MHQFSRHIKGFTLVELLVTIAIIGVLATLLLLQLNAARAKSRDAKRISDLDQIRTAIELYYNDNEHYPTDIAGSISQYLTNGSAPIDPLGISGENGWALIQKAQALAVVRTYYYAYSPGVNPSKFHLYAELEKSNSSLNTDADMNSSAWLYGDTFNAGDPALTEACDNYTFGMSKQCVYDIGLE